MTGSPTRARWQALGTSVELLVADACALDDARTLLERELDAIDRACSRFREDSELTCANSRGGQLVEVSPLLIEAVQVALRAAELTDGDVDPTLGVALELAGYDRDWVLLAGTHSAAKPPQTGRRPADGQSLHPPPPPRVRATVRAGWRAIEVNPEQATIRLPFGVKLDLGATAKAWAADRAARAVYQTSSCGVLISLGGDIATSGPSPAGGWRVHVTDDHRDGVHAPGQTITIAGGGLATSSTVVRRWRKDGHAMHHILDPSTGLPVDGSWRTASVAANDCTDANIAATAALVRGEQAPAWLAELGLPARLVDNDGRVLRIGSWPKPTDRSV